MARWRDAPSTSGAASIPTPTYLGSNGATAMWVTLAAAFLVLFLRRPEAFLHPQFWAEDGPIFFVQADAVGLRAAFLPYSGYYHLLIRLVAAAACQLDPLWVPAVFFWTSIAVTLAVCAALFSSRIELPHRPLFALAIVLVPHTGEVFHNLTNVQWPAALGLILLLIARDPKTWLQRSFDVGVAVLLGLTGVFSILFAPLFVLRAILRRTPVAFVLAGVVVATAAVQAYALAHYSPAPLPPAAQPEGWIDVLRTVGLRLWALLLLPQAWAEHMPAWSLIAGGFIATVILAFRLVARQVDGIVTRVMFWGCAAAITAGALHKFWGLLVVFSAFSNGDRYFVLPKILLLWLLLLEWESAGRWRWISRATCALALVTCLTGFRFERYQDFDWPSWAARIRQGGQVVIPINPAGTTFTFSHRPRH